MLFTRSFPFLMRPAYWRDTHAALFFGIYNGLVLSYLPVVAARLGYPDWLVGLTVAAAFIGYIGSIWYAAHPLRRDCVPACVRAWIIARAIMALMAFTTGRPWLFLLLTLTTYVFEAWAMPAYSVAVQRAYPDDKRGQAMGNVRIFSTSTLLLTALLGGVLLDLLGVNSYQFLFPLGALAGVIAALYFARIRLPHDQTLAPVPVAAALRATLRSPRLRHFTVVQLLCGSGNLLAFPLYILFQVHDLHLSNFSIGMLIALQGLVNALTFFAWGKVIDRAGPLRALKQILLFAPLMPLLYSVADGIWPIVLASIVGGVTLLAWDLAWQSYFYATVRENLQGVMAVQLTLMGLRGLVLPPLGVVLASYLGMQPAFMLAALLMAGGALFLKTTESAE